MLQQIYAKLSNGTYVRIVPDETGKLQRFMNLKNKDSKLYAAYILMKKDLELVTESLLQLDREKFPTIINQSLSFFAIITYSKCFTSNNGRGTSLNTGDVFKNADESLLAEHKRILELRNEYVAHAGSTYEKCTVTVALNEITGIMKLESSLAYVNNIQPNTDTFITLITYLQAYLERKINIFQGRIFEYLQTLTYEELMAQSIEPDANEFYVLQKETTENGSETFVFQKMDK